MLDTLLVYFINKNKMKRFGVLLILLLVFSGCSGGSFEDLNASYDGVLIEQLLPADVSFVLSVTTKDKGQRSSFADFVDEFSDGEEGFLDQIEARFAEMGMDYEEDVKPILGDDGFRLVMAYSGEDSYVAMTVSDKEKAEEWMAATAESGEATAMELGDLTIYVSGDSGYESYTALIGDVLMVTGDSASLVNAKGRFLVDSSDSLISNDDYIDVVSELEAPYLGYVYVDIDEYKQNFGESVVTNSAFGFGNYLIDREAIAVAFDGDQILVDGYAVGDIELIDEIDLGFDDLAGDGVYLAESIPGDGLVFYEESAGIDSLIDLWISKTSAGDPEVAEAIWQSLETYVTQYMAMDLRDELIHFLDKGYAIAVNEDEGSVVPGVSVVIDVSSGQSNAEELMTRLDSQITSLVSVLQYDQTSPWGSIEKGSIEIMGGDFGMVTVDLEAVQQVLELYYGASSDFSFEGEVLNLMYGVTEDALLVITTYDGWEDFDQEVVSILSDIKVYDETIFYLNFENLASYLETYSDFTSDPTVSDMIKGYIDGLQEAVFGMDAGRDEVRLEGVIS